MIELCQVWRPDSNAFLVYIQFDDKLTEFEWFDKICKPYKIISDDINSITIKLVDTEEK